MTQIFDLLHAWLQVQNFLTQQFGPALHELQLLWVQ